MQQNKWIKLKYILHNYLENDLIEECLYNNNRKNIDIIFLEEFI